MNANAPDRDLVSADASEASEMAFRALVSRHADMVYATALRQTGDAALAEEITQNVFISLARKAPRLAGLRTLGGWLFRAAILETKACVRGKLRRQRHELEASEMLALREEGTSTFADLLPLLDESLLSLRQSDRLALVLRFLEERSFREVGAALGVDEDAARKRVDRALEMVGEFFRRRGFVVPSAGGASALLSSAAHAAPPALAASVSGVALASRGGAGAIHTVLNQLMHLTRTQIASATVVLVAVPLVWQHFSQLAAVRQRAAIEAKIGEASRRTDAVESEAADVERAAELARFETANVRVKLDRTEAQIANPAARPRYHWDDNSRFARVPRGVLEYAPLYAIEGEKLSGQIKEALQMTPSEAEQVQQAVYRLLANYEALEAKGARRVTPTEAELKRHVAKEVRALDVPYIGSNQMAPLRREFFAKVTAILGRDRADIFTNSLSPWMPPTDEYANNAGVIYCSTIHAVFYQPKPEDKRIYGIMELTGPQRCGQADDFDPDDMFRKTVIYAPGLQPYIQDWIDQIRNTPP